MDTTKNSQAARTQALTHETRQGGRKEASMAPSITAVPATEPGALAGYQATCPECGDVWRSSLESALRLDLERHLAWHRQAKW